MRPAIALHLDFVSLQKSAQVQRVVKDCGIDCKWKRNGLMGSMMTRVRGRCCTAFSKQTAERQGRSWHFAFHQMLKTALEGVCA